MQALQVIVMVAILAIMCAEGMRVSPRDLGFVWRRPQLLARALLAVVVLVPVAAIAVVLLLRPDRRVAVALAVLAASPLAPFVIKNVMKRGPSPAFGASMHVALAALSVLTTPAALWLVAHALDFRATVAPFAIAMQVATTVLLPFGAGVLVAAAAPRIAERARGPLEVAGTLLLLAVLVMILARGWPLLAGLDARSYVAIASFCVLAFASGHLLGRTPAERSALAFESAARNPALAILIATSSFEQARPAPVLVPYFVVYLIVAVLYGRFASRTAPRRAEGTSGALRPSAS